MEEWKTYKIGEIADVQTGPFGSQLHNDDYVSVGTPIVTVEHLGARKFTTQNLPLVSLNDKNRLSKYIAREGDIIFSRVGSVDRCSYVSRNEDGWLFSGRCLRVRPHAGIDPLYLYYWFTKESTKKEIRNVAVGATMPSINTKLLSDLIITVPPYNFQQRVATILDTIDSKIELNNRINHNLEQQAQALYKSWFVDFEPFKDGKFVESELGMIPEGWRVGNLGELLDIRYGKDHKNLSDGPYPVYGSGGFMRKVERPLFEGESVLIPRKGSLNNVMYVNEAFWSVDTMFYSVEKMPNVAKYCYQILSQKDLASMNSGSAVPSMSTDILNTIQVIIPDKKVLEYYNIILSRVFSSCASIRNESFCLVDIRNSILPKLMNGEILC